MFLKYHFQRRLSILTAPAVILLTLAFLWLGTVTTKTVARNDEMRLLSGTFPGTGVGAIPDGVSGATPQYGEPLNIEFEVSGIPYRMNAIFLDLTMTHSWAGDVEIILKSPNNLTQHSIVNRIGKTTPNGVGDSSNFGGIYSFGDNASANIWKTATASTCGTDCIIAPSIYRTFDAGSNTPTSLFAAFSGLTPSQINGKWTLSIRDALPGDTGAVTAANLTILSYRDPPTPTPVTTPTVTPTITSSLQDGGFEFNTGTTIITNPFWISTSTAFTTSLCTTSGCGTDGGTAAPRTGNGWVWFDGTRNGVTAENASVEQSMVIPRGTSTLIYYFRAGAVTPPANSVMTFSIDGTVLQTINEPVVADSSYSFKTVSIAAYANNAAHTIKFTYTRPAGTTGSDSFLLDDISLILPGNSRTKTPFDFDADGKADLSVFRPENGSWYIQQSQNGFTGLAFGISTDKLVPADYDGDGKTDVAVVRNGTWYLQRSQAGFTGIQFGADNDIPVPSDFDGDGKTDLAVFRPSNGNWYVLNSSNNQFTATLFGANGDKPIPADYDGDGKTDIAVNRNGNWYLNRSQLGFIGILFGDSNDKLVPADYDGDGKTDLAVFRPSNGTWYLQQSSAGFAGITFGLGTDIPVAADYDGDGKADLAVVRNGNWYLNRTTQGFVGIQFGTSTDLPIPNTFIR